MAPVERLSVDLGLHQQRDEVVGPLIGGQRCAFVHADAEVLQRLEDRIKALLKIVETLLEDANRPVREHLLVGSGHAEHMCDDPHRDVLRIVPRRIRVASLRDRVEQLPGKALGDWRHRLNSPRRKRREQDPSRPGVFRRIRSDRWGRQQRSSLPLALGQIDDPDPPRREVIGVMGNRRDVVVVDRHPGAPTALREGDRAAVAQFTPHASRVGDEPRIEYVEIAAPVLGGRNRQVAGGAFGHEWLRWWWVVSGGRASPTRSMKHNSTSVSFIKSRRGSRRLSDGV